MELPPEMLAVCIEFFSDVWLGIRSLIIPAAILYAALLALAKQRHMAFGILSWLSVTAFYLSSQMVQLQCSSARSLQLFTVAIGIMKALDLFARRHSPPEYAFTPRPSDAVVALCYMTELRYESFIPNQVSTAAAPQSDQDANSMSENGAAKGTKNGQISKFELSENTDLLLHGTVFSILQLFFPQSNPTVLALELLLAIYVLWESIQVVLRYSTSPRLFGPIYKVSSLASFWSETWHSAFASPCRSLAYGPLRWILPRCGAPAPLARAAGIVASFGFMGLFHVSALTPLLSTNALLRVGAFFLLNGVGTVIEGAIWGKRAHWLKALLAWVFELIIASWTVDGMSLPKGLGNLDWNGICHAGRESSSHIFWAV